MKLFTLIGLLFVLVLCLSVFSTEGRNHKKSCCKMTPKQMIRFLTGAGTGTHNGRDKSRFSPEARIGSGPRGMPGQLRRPPCKPCKPRKGSTKLLMRPQKVGPLPPN